MKNHARKRQTDSVRRFLLGGIVKSCGTESRDDHAASFRSVRSTNRPFTNFAPARTSATSSGALTLLHLPSAASISLKHMASPASREPGPLVTSVRARTGENVDSMGLEVRRWIQC